MMLENMNSGTECCVMLDLPQTTLCIQDKKLISLPLVLQFYFSALLQTGGMLCNIFILYRLPSFHSDLG
jgi:hypothetical protein